MNPDRETIYIGLSIESMKDEETLLEFKTRAFNLIKQYRDIKLKDISLITTAWLDY